MKTTPTSLKSPSTIKGVSPSKLYLADNYNGTLGQFFAQKFSHINDWQARFTKGLVLGEVGGVYMPLRADTPYVDYQYQTIFYYKQVADEVVVPFDYNIIFENERFLVADKPHFLAVAPSGQHLTQTLLTRLKQATQNEYLSPAHRLDRETAGLVLIIKKQKYRGVYQSLFANQHLQKIYHAIAPFDPKLSLPIMLQLRLARSDPFYTMQVVDGIANSQTHIDLLELSPCWRWAKYQLTPTTGKLHQLRVHLNHLGIAIKNDPFYPVINHKPANDFSHPLKLLAHSLSFVDPIDSTPYRFVSQHKLSWD